MSNDKCKSSETNNEYIDFLTNNYLSYDDMYRHMVNANTASRFQNTDEDQDVENMIEDNVDEIVEDDTQEMSEDMAEEFAEYFYDEGMSNDEIDFEELINEYRNGGYDPYRMPIGVTLSRGSYQEDMANYYRPNHREVEEDRLDDDIDYMKGMYPRAARIVLQCIEDECDKLEYTGSCMFDEYPDFTNINRIVVRIYENVKNMNMNVNENDNKDGEVEIKQCCYDRYCPYNRCVECCDDGTPNWLFQMVQTMFFQEMANRRRRYRYRRWR